MITDFRAKKLNIPNPFIIEGENIGVTQYKYVGYMSDDQLKSTCDTAYVIMT